MKTQHETTIQFSGYPLSVVETQHATKKAELTIVKPSPSSTLPISFQKDSIVNDPDNWDVDWFNSYE